MGGAPPPRSGCARSFVLHFVPLCNTSVVIRPTFLVASRELRCRKWRVCSGVAGGEAWVDHASTTARSGADRAAATGLASLRGSPYAWSAFRRWTWKGFGKGLRRDSIRMTRAIALPLLCIVSALAAAGCGESAGAGGDADPASLVPASAPVYAEAAVQPTGELRDDALAAAGKLLRTDDPAGRLRQLVNDGLAENERWVDVGEGLRAVARRGGRRLGERPGGARADLGGRRGDEGRRGGCLGARALPRGRSRRDVHGPIPRRDRLRGRRRGRRERRGRRLRRHRDGGRVQAHGRPARRRRDARGRGPVRERGRGTRRRQPRPLLRGPAAAARRRAAGRTRRAPRSSSR